MYKFKNFCEQVGIEISSKTPRQAIYDEYKKLKIDNFLLKNKNKELENNK
jgi:hypothetical protein